MTDGVTDPMDKQRALYGYLVAAARAGDETALARLAEHSAPKLLAHAARLLGERQTAEDMVQAAWIEILRGLPGLRDEASFLPWAMRIVSRRVARAIQGRRRDRRLAADWSAEADATAPSDGPAAADAAAVRAALDQLDDAHRATLALFYLEEMTVAEAAVALDIPAGTVKTRLMRARSKLKALLEGDRHVQD